MEKTVKDILRNTYLEHGDAVFCDKIKLAAVLSDVLYSFPKERKRIMLAVNENIPKKIINDASIDENRASYYIDLLSDIYNLPTENSQEIIGVIYYVLYGVDSINDVVDYNNTINTHDDKSTVIEREGSSNNFKDVRMKFRNNIHSITIPENKSKKIMIALLLIPYTGWFGAYYFYLGNKKEGLKRLFTLNFLFIGWMIDIMGLFNYQE